MERLNEAKRRRDVALQRYQMAIRSGVTQDMNECLDEWEKTSREYEALLGCGWRRG